MAVAPALYFARQIGCCTRVSQVASMHCAFMCTIGVPPCKAVFLCVGRCDLFSSVEGVSIGGKGKSGIHLALLQGDGVAHQVGM
jgi:hypothetical protein